MFKWFYSLSERKYDFFCKKLEKLVRWMLISNISIFSLGNRKSNANICLGREVSTNSYSDTGRDQLKSIASKVSISYSIKYVYTCWSVWLPGYGISGKGHGWSKYANFARKKMSSFIIFGNAPILTEKFAKM